MLNFLTLETAKCDDQQSYITLISNCRVKHKCLSQSKKNVSNVKKYSSSSYSIWKRNFIVWTSVITEHFLVCKTFNIIKGANIILTRYILKRLLQNFSEILKRLLQNFSEILKKCLLGTRCILLKSLLCGEYLNMETYHYAYGTRRNIFSRFSSNSEAFASELIENLEEMFPR